MSHSSSELLISSQTSSLCTSHFLRVLVRTQGLLLPVLMRREGSAVSLSITTFCRSTVSLTSEASVESVELRFNE